MEQQESQQAVYLQDAMKKVVEQAFYMKRAMDHGNVPASLKHAGDMLAELKTARLSPKNYYQLYMKLLDELRYLEEFITSLNRQGTPIVALYEQVQANSSVLVRLYLLITVGAVYINSREAPAADVLKDLIEMAKGVQQPTRGLFLRNYLSHATRDKLPDGPPRSFDGTSGAAGGGGGGGVEGAVEDSVDFVLENFSEANRLWVRMHNQGPAKDKKRRDRERKDLRLLVGTNLVRLSQLEGVDLELYKTVILPKVLEQIVACKDTIAQSYLMDCVIQVFPDEFHLVTLDVFLDGVAKLKEKVRVRPILESLMQRLGNFVENSGGSVAMSDAAPPLGGGNGAGVGGGDGSDGGGGKAAASKAAGSSSVIPAEVKAYQAFNECIARLIQERETLPLSEIVHLEVALVRFSIMCYPDRLDYVDHCIGVCAQAMVARGIMGGEGGLDQQQLPADCVTSVENLLSIPVESLTLRVLEFEYYAQLMQFLPQQNQCHVAAALLRAVLGSRQGLRNPDELEKLFDIITPLLKGSGQRHHQPHQQPPPTSQQNNYSTDSGSVAEEDQKLVARLIHLIGHEDTDVFFRCLIVARRHLMKVSAAEGRQPNAPAAGGGGGAGASADPRLQYTLVPLVFVALKLARKVRRTELVIAEEMAQQPDLLNLSAPAVVEAAPGTENGNGFAEEGEEEDKLIDLIDDDGSGGGGGVAENGESTAETLENGESGGGENGVVIAEQGQETAEQGDGGGGGGGGGGGTEGGGDLAAAASVLIAAVAPAVAAVVTDEIAAAVAPVATTSPPRPSTPPPPPKALQYSCRKVFQFLHELVTTIAPSSPSVSLNLFLQCAIAANQASFKAISYEFYSQAFVLYEDDIADSKAQVLAIEQIVGALMACPNFDSNDYDALITKTTQYAAKLLKKPDQCRMVVLCSHLFWSEHGQGGAGYRDGRRVLECLQRSLKIADVCMASGTNVQLFIEILNHYVYFYEQETPKISEKYISGVIALVREHIESMDPSDLRSQVQAYFDNTLEHIEFKMNATECGKAMNERFQAITL